MRKNGRKIKLQRETLRLLSDEGQRLAVGGLASKLCTETAECTQSLCGGVPFTYFCATDNTANTCNQVFSCGSCLLVTCGC